MKKFYYIIIIALLCSCVPKKKVCQKRIRKYVENYPSLMVKDTVVIKDTIPFYVSEVKVDTIIRLEVDSIEIIEERLKIKYVKKDNYIYLSGECEADTIYKYIEKEIEIPVIDAGFKDLSIMDVFNESWWVLLLVIIIVLVIKLLQKKI